MTSFVPTTRLFLAAATAAALASAPAPALAISTGGAACATAVASAMAKCTKKATSVQVGCYKKLGTPCSNIDTKITGAQAGVTKAILAGCVDAAAVADAGYAPYTPSSLGASLGDRCLLESRVAVERTCGFQGGIFADASEDDRKCLLTAAKTTGKILGKGLKIVTECAATGCAGTTDDDAIATLGTDAGAKLAAKCGALTTLTGLSPAGHGAAAAAQVPSAVAAFCDPMETGRCAFPFPNDYFAIPSGGGGSAGRVALGRQSLSQNIGGNYTNPAGFNTTDGFSVGPMIIFSDADIDLGLTGATPITDLAEHLNASTPAVLIDAETGDREMMWLERDTRGASAADQPIIGHVGRNLKNSHRYIVALRNMKDSGGFVIPAPTGFALYRDDTPTDLLPVEARRPHMEEIFDTLATHGIARNDLYLAWDFTTQSTASTAGRLLQMRDDAFAELAAAAPDFTVTSVEEPLDADIFRMVDGTFEVPLYLLNGGDPGSNLLLNNAGLPRRASGSYTANFRCVIPYAATTGGAAPAVPARISVYGHGLLGSYEEVDAGNIRKMANEHNFVFCATYWAGFSENDVLFVAQAIDDWSKFPTFIDVQHQGMLNMQVLGRLLSHADGFASHAAFQVGGESVLDRSELFYDGNSQGGILGHVLAAVSADIERFVLGVPGINYSILLHRSVDFDSYDTLFQAAYPSSTDRNFNQSVAQMIWDRTDPNGHVRHVLSDTYEGTPAKKLLMQVAFGDHQVAPVTAEIAARSNGMLMHTPAVPMAKVLPEVTPYYDIDPVLSYPYDGSVLTIWDSGNPAPPTYNEPPAEITPLDLEWADLGPCPQGRNSDPHSCPRSNMTARSQKSAFLQTGGTVIDVCGGAACLAP